MKDENVHKNHRKRLRARFLREGLANFEPHEVLELILTFSVPRQNTNPTGHALIERFGSFASVLDAPFNELIEVHGVGEISATLFKIMVEAGGYYRNSLVNESITILNTTEKAGEFFLPKFFGKQNEQLYMASLDDKRKVINCAPLSEEGIVNAVKVSVRKIVAEAMTANATGVILAHNHPGGLALPSNNDKQVTRQAFQALRLINVQLLDHIIVADEDFVSLADSGFMDILAKESPY